MSSHAATGFPEQEPAVRWLHLSDLHLGSPGRALWWQVHDDFARSIRDGVERLGPPELILISGDLTNTGVESEFDLVDQFLDRLLVWIDEAAGGGEPVIIAIPGNHDLVRPQGVEAFPFLVLEQVGARADDPSVKLLLEKLWTERDASFLDPLFAPYLAWWKRRILPRLEAPDVRMNRSHFPGDLSVHLDLDARFSLCVVGLNSTWMQTKAGDFEGRLELPTEQFHAALDRQPQGSPLDALEAADRALLLMHHPPSWLSPRGQAEFFSSIYTPERFALCLHGHLHKARSQGLSLAGGPPRIYFQAPSLFGLEHYGTSREERAFGYAWGKISAAGEVRVWPLSYITRGDGTAAFIHDPEFYDDAGKGAVLRVADAARPTPSRGERAPKADRGLDTYRRWARERYRGVSLLGVGGGDLRLRLDEVYVPLKISRRPLHGEREEREADRRGDSDSAGDPELGKIFSEPRADGMHLVIFGDPGAGKTTVLVKLHQLCLSAGAESLGLAAGTVPILVRLRQLRVTDLDVALEEVLDRELRAMTGGEVGGDLGRRLWRRGRLLLLLDGLDEIADETLRAGVCKYLKWQLSDAVRRHIRAVVSCRYAGYGGAVRLDEGFLHLDIRPLDAEQCRHLVRLWFREVQRTLPDYPESDARAAAEGLIAALDGADYRTQRLKVLVGSPLLLTLLCVVVLRGGEMPRHRAAFYEQCLRVLLGQWSRSKAAADKSWQPLVDVDTALAILRPLAYALHAQRRRDDLSGPELVLHVEERLDELGQAASAFEVIEWLHREAGVIEEYAPQQYGFVHLGFQEYLAALHIAARGEELLDELLACCDEQWWHEVVLLLVGLPGRRIFAPLMERLLRSNVPDLVRAGLEEAVEVDPEPFLAVLDESGDPQQQALVLRLLRGRTDPRLIARAEALVRSHDRNVAALARQLVATGDPTSGAGEEFDVFLLHHPTETEHAGRFRQALDRQGFRVAAGEDTSSMANLKRILESTRGVALLVGPSGEVPWDLPGIEHCLRLFARRRRTVVPVLLPGSRELLPLPGHLSDLPWIDLRRGLAEPGLEAFGRALSGQRELGPPVERAGPCRIPGESFTEPLTGVHFLWMPGGRFVMGSERYENTRPIHEVRISPFWLAETPVTNKQYAVFLEHNPSHHEPAFWRDRRFSAAEQPVVAVSWHDAVDYCRWLAETAGFEAMLPSEAQWEFAARGIDGREYPWGNEEPDASHACFGLDWENGQPAPVGSYPSGQGPFATLDQAGGVWEWCRDAWDEAAYEKRGFAPGKEVVDPCVEAGGHASRSARGGCWRSPARDLRAACRHWYPATRRVVGFGFRLAATENSR